MLALNVPISHFSGPCAGSPESVLDSIPVGHGKRTPSGALRYAFSPVIGIAKIMDRDTVVGWIYRTKENSFYVQVMPNMPAHDQREAKIHPIRYDARFKRSSNHQTPLLYSDLVRIQHWPWRDLQMAPCTSGDLIPSLQRRE